MKTKQMHFSFPKSRYSANFARYFVQFFIQKCKIYFTISEGIFHPLRFVAVNVMKVMYIVSIYVYISYVTNVSD